MNLGTELRKIEQERGQEIFENWKKSHADIISKLSDSMRKKALCGIHQLVYTSYFLEEDIRYYKWWAQLEGLSIKEEEYVYPDKDSVRIDIFSGKMSYRKTLIFYW